MTASEQALRLWEAAKVMAAAMEAIGKRTVELGVIPADVLVALAELAHVRVHVSVFANGTAIDSIWGSIGDVTVCAQANVRPATPEEIAAAGGDSAQAGGAA